MSPSGIEKRKKPPKFVTSRQELKLDVMQPMCDSNLSQEASEMIDRVLSINSQGTSQDFGQPNLQQETYNNQPDRDDYDE